jgi:hypothetical protein
MKTFEHVIGIIVIANVVPLLFAIKLMYEGDENFLESFFAAHIMQVLVIGMFGFLLLTLWTLFA